MDKTVEIEVLSALTGPDAGECWGYGTALQELYFDYTPARVVFRLLQAHWRRTKDLPSQGLLRTYLKGMSGTLSPDLFALAEEVVSSAYLPAKPTSKAFVRDFILHKECEELGSFLEGTALGEHESLLAHARERIDRLQNLATKKNTLVDVIRPFSEDFLDNWMERMEESYGGVPVPIGYERLDYYLPPLYPGEMGMFVAPTGRGKSLWLVNLAWHYVHILGLRVLYVALDNPAGDFAKRFLTRGTGVPIEMARKFLPRDVLTRRVQLKMREKLSEAPHYHRLEIAAWPRSTLSAKDLHKYLEEVRPSWHQEDLKNGVPEEKAGKLDVLLLDYSDLMIPSESSRDSSDWKRLQVIVNDVAAVGQTENFVTWNLSQTSKAALEKAQGMASEWHIAESFAKFHPVRLGIMMQQAPWQKSKGLFNAYICKCNNGPSGIVFPFKVDYKLHCIHENLDLEPFWVGGDEPLPPIGGLDPEEERNEELIDDAFRDV